jgi:uncharacterized membrane protein YidH (DUF202 family)
MNTAYNTNSQMTKCSNCVECMSCFRSKTFDNQGSEARDHLANERTYLAWIRTSLSFIAIGIAVIEFLQGIKSIIGGSLFIVLGVLYFILAIYRYYQVTNLLVENKFETSGTIILIISLIFGVLIITIIGLLFSDI